MITRWFFLLAHKQRVRIGAIGKLANRNAVEHDTPVNEQDKRARFPVGHVTQLRTIVAFRFSAIADIPFGGQRLDEIFLRRRVNQRLPFVRRRLATWQLVAVRLLQLLAVSATFENCHIRLRRVVGLRHDERRDRHEERDATQERSHGFENPRTPQLHSRVSHRFRNALHTGQSVGPISKFACELHWSSERNFALDTHLIDHRIIFATRTEVGVIEIQREFNRIQRKVLCTVGRSNERDSPV